MRSRFLSICLLTGLVFNSFHIYSQVLGGHSPSDKWYQINTDTVKIIFQQAVAKQANQIAWEIHQLARQNQLGSQIRKVDIILQNKTTVANGYVGLGPFRSEFYLTPSVSSFEQGANPWSSQLALHEYRHVQQFNNFNHGISKLVKKLFGEEGYSLAINTAIPNWFFEGDAVYSETIHSRQGRGRLPQFLSAFPVLWQDGKNYSWQKLRNGSYKDYVPNHYNLGYLLVNYGYQKYGNSFWEKVTKRACSFDGLFYPMQKAIKKETGFSYKQFCNDAFNHYRDNLKTGANGVPEQAAAIEAKNIFPINKNYVINYLYPYIINDSSLIYEKRDARNRPAFYLKSGSRIKKISNRNISDNDQFAYRGGKIVYSSYSIHPRWRWNDYSLIEVIDANTGNKTTIRGAGKYFTPDISADGQQIVAVQNNEAGKSSLHVLDANTGKVKAQIQSQDVLTFTDPRFINADSIITAVRLHDGRMALAIAEITTGNTFRMGEPTNNVIGNLHVEHDTVYFTASYLGRDNLYAMHLPSQNVYRLTNGLKGDYQVNVKGNRVMWVQQSADGYQLLAAEKKDLLWKKMPLKMMEPQQTIFPVAIGNSSPNIIQTAAAPTSYNIKPYKSATNMFNFHSWRPYYENPELTLTLYGQNVLNFFQSEIYYAYNQNDKASTAGANVILARWFPFLTAGTSFTLDRSLTINKKLKQWNQADFRIGYSIPLVFVKGQTIQQFNIGTNYSLRKDFNFGAFKDSFRAINYSYLHHFISWGQRVQATPQQILPRLAYNMGFQIRHTITNYYSRHYIASAGANLPGILPTHTLALNAAWQTTDTSTVLFGNVMAYSRGYNSAYFATMWRASANYHFPIVYPDFGLFNIAYLYRLRGNIFCDYTRGYSKNKFSYINNRSAGIELYADCNWWNQYSLSFGIRITRLLDKDLITKKRNTLLEIVLPLTIFPY